MMPARGASSRTAISRTATSSAAVVALDADRPNRQPSICRHRSKPMLKPPAKKFAYPVSDVDPFSREYLLDPYPFHEQLREAGPVVWLTKWNCWGTGRHKEMNEILADPKTFNSAAGVGIANFNNEKPWRPPSLLLEADPPAHTKRRAVVGKVLSPANLRRLRADFEREAAALVGRILERGRVDGVRDIAEPYILKVFPDSVGLDENGRENLLAYGAMVFNAFGPENEILQASIRNVEPARG